MQKDLQELNNNVYMTFTLGAKNYTVCTSYIIEILKLPELFYLEHLPSNVVGLLNFRGTVISVVDLRSLLGLEKLPYNTDQHVIVVDVEGEMFGAIVDALGDVMVMESSDIDPIPYSNHSKFLSGIYNDNGNIIALLDLLNFKPFIFAKEDPLEQDVELSPVKNALMPVDELSLQKMHNRALSLKKEVKLDINRNIFIKDKFVMFLLENEKYCISLNYIKEFKKLKNETILEVPGVPPYIKGIISFRGDFISVIDVKYFLNIPASIYTDKAKIIFIRTSTLKLGLLVDEVFDIMNIPVENLRSASQNNFDSNAYIVGEILMEDNQLANILNVERLFSEENLNYEDYV